MQGRSKSFGAPFASYRAMDKARFLSELALRLFDPTHEVFSTDELNIGLASAVREYSKYRPLQRPYGFGQVYAGASPGSTLEVVGGPFVVGAQIIVDLYGQQETVEITGIAPTSGGDTAGVIGSPSTLTVTPDLAYSHQSGATVANTTLGLQLVAGQSDYVLPMDFISVDHDTFDPAIGLRPSAVRQVGAYDGVYTFTDALSNVGPGSRAGWVSSVDTGPYLYPWVGSGIDVRVVGSAIPVLRFMPAPGGDALINFYYNALHLVETVPEFDQDPCLEYAVYATVLAKGIDLGRRQPGARADIKWDPDKAAEQLTALANAGLAEWKRNVVKRGRGSRG